MNKEMYDTAEKLIAYMRSKKLLSITFFSKDNDYIISVEKRDFREGGQWLKKID